MHASSVSNVVLSVGDGLVLALPSCFASCIVRDGHDVEGNDIDVAASLPCRLPFQKQAHLSHFGSGPKPHRTMEMPSNTALTRIGGTTRLRLRSLTKEADRGGRAGQPKKKKTKANTNNNNKTGQARPNELNRLELDGLESVLPEGAAERRARNVEVSPCRWVLPPGQPTRGDLQEGGGSVLAVVEEGDHAVGAARVRVKVSTR